jgi:hypothetical protein
MKLAFLALVLAGLPAVAMADHREYRPRQESCESRPYDYRESHYRPTYRDYAPSYYDQRGHSYSHPDWHRDHYVHRHVYHDVHHGQVHYHSYGHVHHR